MEDHLNTALTTAEAFSDDPALRSLVLQCRTTLAINLDRLRNSKMNRLDLGQKAKAIVNNFGGGNRRLAA
jgi:hypothetical protein